MITFLQIPRDAAERMYLLGPAPRYSRRSEYNWEQARVRAAGLNPEAQRVAEFIAEFDGGNTPLADDITQNEVIE